MDFNGQFNWEGNLFVRFGVGVLKDVTLTDITMPGHVMKFKV